MLIQSAEMTAAPGRSSEIGPLTAGIRDFLSAETGREWWSWAVLAGRPFGTYMLTSRADGYTDLVAGQVALATSADWAKLTGSAAGVLNQPAETYLNEVIAVTGEPAPPKQFLTITRATMAGGDIGATLAWSTQVMEHVTKITGNSGNVSMSAAGRFFDVFWASGVDTAEELDAAMQTINGDAEYVEMVSAAGAAGMFVDGLAERAILVKMP
ncbi:hypothetical protein [Ilumatobacter sp.]|uniref:hypothetical protein n=1 Tax=Ilumatobacter sp. TaxID=1967498 RepID=UPI003C3140DB